MLVNQELLQSKLSDVVKKGVVKRNTYDESFKKVNDIQNTDTSNSVKKRAMAQRLVKFKTKYLIMITLNMLILTNLIS